MGELLTLVYTFRYIIRVRVRERLSATPGHVIGQGPAPGGQIVHCGGGSGGGGNWERRAWSQGRVLQTSLACTVKLTIEE